MTEKSPLTSEPDVEPNLTPADLWKAVLVARDALAQERHLRQRQSEPSARLALLEALEAYVGSLDERGHPVPYALRDELRLQRLTTVTNGSFRSLAARAQPERGRSPR
jgi:hypothetical protein